VAVLPGGAGLEEAPRGEGATVRRPAERTGRGAGRRTARGRLLRAAALSALLAVVASAVGGPPVLTLKAPASLAAGAGLDVRVTLTDGAGTALPDRPLTLLVDGEPLRRVRTDTAGTVTLTAPTGRAGHRMLSAAFEGDGKFGRASASAAIDVRPAVVTVQTVPPVAGIPFTLGGQRFTSGTDGVASLAVDRAGTYDLRVDIPDGLQVDPRTRVSFVRWDGSEFHRTRQVDVSGDTRLQVGLSLSHPVRLHSVDLSGEAVPASRVASVTLQASTGARFTFEDPGPHWLIANRIQRLRSGMVPTTLQYAVASVVFDGSNVVNRFQQRFEVQGDDDWGITLLLYDARLAGRDALFGGHVGSGVLLRYPDGRSVEQAFGADGAAAFHNLARGTYHVRVVGAAGFAPLAPLALSRDQDAGLKVLTILDMTVLGGALLGLAVGLMALGRGVPWHRRRRARRGPASSAHPAGDGRVSGRLVGRDPTTFGGAASGSARGTAAAESEAPAPRAAGGRLTPVWGARDVRGDRPAPSSRSVAGGEGQ